MSLTVITPTYNRAHTLHMCYESLCAQSCKDFLWMIIDDGSTDETEELVNSWMREGIIRIEYQKKTNRGKASALNVALDLVQTKYVVCLDSDDTFYPDTVRTALKALDETEPDEQCCGILALRNHQDGSVMGRREIPRNMTCVTAADIFLKLNLETELICFYKSKMLTRYRFPEFEGEKFVSPAWMQYTVTQEHYFKTSWDRLCCCEYTADGITRNKRKIIVNNPHGYTCVKRMSFDLAPTVKTRIKHGIMYHYGCILGHDKDWLKNVTHKKWAIFLRPAGYVVYLRRQRKGN